MAEPENAVQRSEPSDAQVAAMLDRAQALSRRAMEVGIAEKTLLAITGNHAENPTLDLPCRQVFARGQKDVRVIGPVAAAEEPIAALHRRYWRSK